jgi:hypothetical protein
MELTTIWILLAMLASIFLTVFTLGLNASLEDALYLFRRPKKLCKAELSLTVIIDRKSVV